MRPHGSPTELEARRAGPSPSSTKGLGVREVARQIGCSPASVSRWQADVPSRRPRRAHARSPPGAAPPARPRGSGPRLLKLLLKGATAHGFSTDLWTLAAGRRRSSPGPSGSRYHPAHVWKILRGRGVELPEAGAPGPGAGRGRHPAVADRALAAYKKTPAAAGRSLVFLDESGFMLQPVFRRTWAPRGQTPILRQWDRRDRLSAISALTVAPRRRRFGLYWALHHAQHPERRRSCASSRHLHRHLPHGFTLIWDRSRPHRATRVDLAGGPSTGGSSSSGCRPTRRTSTRSSTSGATPSTATSPTSPRPTWPPWKAPCSVPSPTREASDLFSRRSSGRLVWNCECTIT